MVVSLGGSQLGHNKPRAQTTGRGIGEGGLGVGGRVFGAANIPTGSATERPSHTKVDTEEVQLAKPPETG